MPHRPWTYYRGLAWSHSQSCTTMLREGAAAVGMIPAPRSGWRTSPAIARAEAKAHAELCAVYVVMALVAQE